MNFALRFLKWGSDSISLVRLLITWQMPRTSILLSASVSVCLYEWMRWKSGWMNRLLYVNDEEVG